MVCAAPVSLALSRAHSSGAVALTKPSAFRFLPYLHLSAQSEQWPHSVASAGARRLPVASIAGAPMNLSRWRCLTHMRVPKRLQRDARFLWREWIKPLGLVATALLNDAPCCRHRAALARSSLSADRHLVALPAPPAGPSTSRVTRRHPPSRWGKTRVRLQTR